MEKEILSIENGKSIEAHQEISISELNWKGKLCIFLIVVDFIVCFIDVFTIFTKEIITFEFMMSRVLIFFLLVGLYFVFVLITMRFGSKSVPDIIVTKQNIDSVKILGNEIKEQNNPKINIYNPDKKLNLKINKKEF